MDMPLDELLKRLSAEEEALISGLRMEALPSRELDWLQIQRLAEAHEVPALLHWSWGESVPPPHGVLASFLKARRYNGLMGVVGLRERDFAVGVLSEAGIPCMVLKGAALARYWYGDISLRRFIDIDLLVPETQSRAAYTTLLEAGYMPVASTEETDYHEMPLSRPGVPFSVEIHHALTALPVHRAPTFATLQERAMSVPGELPGMLTLSVEDTLLHLCVHLLQHLIQAGGWQLRYLYDIKQHVTRFNVNWELFLERAKVAGAERACAVALGLVSLVLSATIPEEQTDPVLAANVFMHMARADVDEHWLGRILVALRHLDFKRASSILSLNIAMKHDGGEPHRGTLISASVRPIWRLTKFGIGERENLRRQLRDWFAIEKQREQDRRLIIDLLAPDSR